MILGSKQESSEAEDKAIEELLNKVSEAWLRANVLLFKHVLDYEVKMDAFLNKAGGWIRAQKECIWMTLASNYRGPQSAIMCWPRYCVLPAGNPPLLLQ